MSYKLLTFKSVNYAMAAEKKTKDLGTRLITLPSWVTSDCGFGLKVGENLEAVLKILSRENIEGIYDLK
ncbi:conserved hypothetical protein [Peptoniphilus harei ACS-146-V-Sch2b]|uniref:Putative Se/S carrier protein-like domain-containing protein n=1 Tax=Peptoniphilus harei ACS-146-V-Sch2b TaxID=908338 RepID=E4KWQ8_9FIRM|nr:putative Se/S carrier-like protein [Peptoniphilus harei]EFR33719.1 conserved hypothetical protein [Peptoniphilus harei ACS-146-V-Sch2b]